MKGTRASAADRIKQAVSQPYFWPCLGAILVSHALAYYGTRLLLPYLPVHTLNLPLDAAIPCIPEWVCVYCLAFLSWVFTGFIILIQGKEPAVRLARAYVIGMVLSAIAFLAWPLTLERPEIVGNGLWRELLRTMYRLDEPNNLCPSLHVLVSYFCWRGLWGCPRIPKWFKGFNLCFLTLVCLSVVFVKQHLVIDIWGGIAVGEASMQASRLMGIRRAARKE